MRYSSQHLLGWIILVIITLSQISGTNCDAQQRGNDTAAPSNAKDTIAATTDDAHPGSLRVRRILIPHDRIHQWPDTNERFVPYSAKRFEEQMQQSAGSRHHAQPIETATRVARASYRATIGEDQAITGSAILEIGHTRPTSSWLQLGRPNFAIDTATWETEGSTIPVTLGTSARGESLLHVSAAGRLQFQWSTRPEKAADHYAAYRLRFPRCETTRLTLTLPSQMSLHIDEGAILHSLTQLKDQREWHLVANPTSELRFRVTDSTSLAPTHRVAVQHHTTYRLSETRTEVVARLHVDVLDHPIDHLPLTLDPNLRVVSVQLGDQSIPWDFLTRSNTSQQIALRFDDLLEGKGRELRIVAMAPLAIGTLTKLPILYANGSFWQNATATLIVPEQVQLVQLDTDQARVTAFQDLPAPDRGTAVQIQGFQPSHTISVEVIPTAGRLIGTTHSRVHLTEQLVRTEITANLAMDRDDASSQVFEVHAELQDHWTIESLSTTPQDAILDWSVTRSEKNQRMFRIRLARGITSRRPLTIAVNTALRRDIQQGPLRVSQMSPLRFVDVNLPRRLIQLTCPKRSELKVHGQANLERIQAEDFSPDAILSDEDVGDAIYFAASEKDQDAQVSLLRKSPRFNANLHLNLEVDVSGIAYQLEIECIPDAATLDRVIVRTSNWDDTPWSWTLPDSPQTLITSRRLTADELEQQRLPASDNVWEIAFDKPLAEPFRIEGRARAEFTTGHAVYLPTILGATEQQGHLSIYGDNNAMRIENRRLTAQIRPASRKARSRSLVAHFQYDPIQEGRFNNNPAVMISPHTRQLLAEAVIWNEHLHSHFSPVGIARHLARYDIAVDRAFDLRLRLPKHARLQAVIVNDTPTRATTNDSGQLLIPIENDTQRTFVDVWFDTPENETRWYLSRRLPSVGVPLPIASSRRTYSAPGDYHVFRGQLSRLTANKPAAVQGTTFLDAILQIRPLDGAGNLHNLRIPAHFRDGAFDATHANLWELDSHSETARSGRGVKLLFFHVGTFRAVAWACLIAAAAFCFWRIPRPSTWIATCLILTATAAWLPSPLATLSLATVLGTLIAVVIRCITRRASLLLGSSASTFSSTSALIRLSLFFAISALSAHHTSAEDTESLDESSSPVYRVLIPVDDAQQPTGDTYYLPEGLYRELSSQTASVDPDTPDWVMTSSHYQANLRDINRFPKTDVLEVVAEYLLTTTKDDVHISLPIARHGVALRPSESRLDGALADVQWSTDHTHLDFFVAQHGPHRLRLAFQLETQVTGPRRHTRLAIPSVADSQLEVTLPANGLDVEIPTALGATMFDASGNRLLVSHGPARQLVLQWLDRRATRAALVRGTVDQLTWVRVKPEDVTVDVYFDINIRDGKLPRLKLAADPRLTLIRSTGGKATLNDKTRGGEKLIDIEFARPVSEKASVSLTFQWTDQSGIGNIPIPSIELKHDIEQTKWAAISTAPTLQCESALIDQPLATPTEEFHQHWRPADPLLRYAARQNPEDAPWQFRVFPANPKVQGAQRVTYACDSHQTHIALSADLNIRTGYLLHSQIRIPPQATLHEVSATADAASRLREWTVSTSTNLLTVFFDQPITGEFQLQVEMTIPNPAKKSPIPAATLVDVDFTTDVVHFARSSMVQVDLVAGSKWTSSDTPVTTGEEPFDSRPVAQFERNGDTSGGRWNIIANRPLVDVKQLSTLDRLDKIWRVFIESELDVRDGILDVIRYRVPLDFSIAPSQFQATSDLKYQMHRVPGEAYKILSLRPTQAIDDHFELTMQWNFTPGVGESASLPHVRILDAATSSHFAQLPRQVHLQDVEWDTKGFVSQPLPENWRSLAAGTQDFATFRVVADDALATLKSTKRVAGIPRIRLVDLHLAVLNPGGYSGIASFDLEPQGIATCVLRIPAAVTIEQVLCNGSQVALADGNSETLDLLIESPQLPQRIDILFQSRSASGSILVLPSLETLQGPIAVEKTLWTMYHEPALEIDFTKATVRATTNLDQAVERIQHVTSLLNDTLTEDPIAARLPWIRRWHARLSHARKELTSLRPASTEAQLQRIDQLAIDVGVLLNDLQDRSGEANLVPSGESSSAHATSPAEIIARYAAPRATPHRYVMQSLTTELPIILPSRWTMPTRPLAITLFAAIGIFLISAAKRHASTKMHSLAELEARWNPALATGVGIAIWILTPTSALGPLIMLFSAIWSLRDARRRLVGTEALTITL